MNIIKQKKNIEEKLLIGLIKSTFIYIYIYNNNIKLAQSYLHHCCQDVQEFINNGNNSNLNAAYNINYLILNNIINLSIE